MQKVVWHKRMTPNSKPGENDWIIILYSTDKRVGDLLRLDSICLLYSLAWGYLRLQSQMQVRRWRIKPGTMLGCRHGKHANKDYSRKSAQWVRYPDRLLNSSKTSSREPASHSTVLSSVQVGNNIITGSISCGDTPRYFHWMWSNQQFLMSCIISANIPPSKRKYRTVSTRRHTE